MKRFAYLDIEATHSNWSDAEIIEIAFLIKDEKGKELDHFQSLIKPMNPIEPNITELTGITEKMVENAPEFHEIAQRIYEKLEGTIIVAHKAEFDFHLLQQTLGSLGLPFHNKKICTLNMTQRLIPELRSYTLFSLCDMLQIKIKKSHRAMEDASALAELHSYLRLINGELTEERKYLPEHQKLIENTSQRPGVIAIRNGSQPEFFKTENLFLKLQELLMIKPSNRHRISQFIQIEIKETASLIKAGLIHSKMSKSFYPFCIYQIKNKNGKVQLRVGKTDLKRKALYFTETRKQALKIIDDIRSDSDKTKLAFQDSRHDKSNIIKENIQITKRLKKYIALEKNYLIRSVEKLNGKFEYVIIRGNNSFASFKSSAEIKSSKDISYDKIKFRNIGPREFMSLNHSLQWIKNQRQKTDQLIEIKQS